MAVIKPTLTTDAMNNSTPNVGGQNNTSNSLHQIMPAVLAHLDFAWNGKPAEFQSFCTLNQ